MLGNHSLSGLMKWLTHEEWHEPFADVLDLHLGPACDDYEMDFEDIAEVIGDHAAMTLWGCAFEDFLTQAVEPSPHFWKASSNAPPTCWRWWPLT